MDIELIVRWRKQPKKKDKEEEKTNKMLRDLGLPVDEDELDEDDPVRYSEIFEYFPMVMPIEDIRSYNYANPDHTSIRTPHGVFIIKMAYNIFKSLKEQLTLTKVFNPEDLKRTNISYKDY